MDPKELNQLSDAIVASPVRDFERRVKRRWCVWAGQTRKALFQRVLETPDLKFEALAGWKGEVKRALGIVVGFRMRD